MADRREYYKQYRLKNLKRIARKKRLWYRNGGKKILVALRAKYRNTARICYFCKTDKNIVSHHFDYSKPTEVIKVCHACHMKIHYILSITNK
jgi:hypothetical protein